MFTPNGRLAQSGLFASVVIVLVGAQPSRAQDGAPIPPSIGDLVREALESNPEVELARRAVEVRRARVPQAGALHDPSLTYGVLNEGQPVPFQTLGEKDFSEAYVGISQDLPYPGKRALREEVASREVVVAERAYEATRRQVAAQVAEDCYELYAIRAASEIIERNVQLLDQLTSVARTRFAVGQVSQQDVLDAEVELSRLEERRSVLAERRGVVEADLARLLSRTSPVVFETSRPLFRTPLPATLEELLQRAEAESPVLREKEAAVARGERAAALARRERLPDFGANFSYHNRGGLDPYYAFGGTITLPLHAARKQKRVVEEEAANLGVAQGASDAARAEVRYEVTRAYLMASRADRLLLLYDEGILKQARLSLDSVIAQYEVGKADFLTLITSWRRLLDYDLAYHEQLAEHEKAVARLAVHVDDLAKEVF